MEAESSQRPSLHESNIVSAEEQLPYLNLQPESRSLSYLRRHWRGEHSLAQSFWLNTILVGLLLSLLVLTFQATITEETLAISPRVVATFFLVKIALIYVISLWQVVGLWRSAGAHFLKTQGSPWAAGVQVLIVLAVLGQVRLAATTVLPLMTDFGQIALGQGVQIIRLDSAGGWTSEPLGSGS